MSSGKMDWREKAGVTPRGGGALIMGSDMPVEPARVQIAKKDFVEWQAPSNRLI